jgi:hypothetical protein
MALFEPVEATITIFSGCNFTLPSIISSSIYATVFVNGICLGSTHCSTRTTTPVWNKSFRVSLTSAKDTVAIIKVFNGAVGGDSLLLGWISIPLEGRGLITTDMDPNWVLRDGTGSLTVVSNVTNYPDLSILRATPQAHSGQHKCLVSLPISLGFADVSQTLQCLFDNYPSVASLPKSNLGRYIADDIISLLGEPNSVPAQTSSSSTRAGFKQSMSRRAAWVLDIVLYSGATFRSIHLEFLCAVDYYRAVSSFLQRGVAVNFMYFFTTCLNSFTMRHKAASACAVAGLDDPAGRPPSLVCLPGPTPAAAAALERLKLIRIDDIVHVSSHSLDDVVTDHRLYSEHRASPVQYILQCCLLRLSARRVREMRSGDILKCLVSTSRGQFLFSAVATDTLGSRSAYFHGPWSDVAMTSTSSVEAKFKVHLWIESPSERGCALHPIAQQFIATKLSVPTEESSSNRRRAENSDFVLRNQRRIFRVCVKSLHVLRLACPANRVLCFGLQLGARSFLSQAVFCGPGQHGSDFVREVERTDEYTTFELVESNETPLALFIQLSVVYARHGDPFINDADVAALAIVPVDTTLCVSDESSAEVEMKIKLEVQWQKMIRDVAPHLLSLLSNSPLLVSVISALESVSISSSHHPDGAGNEDGTGIDGGNGSIRLSFEVQRRELETASLPFVLAARPASTAALSTDAGHIDRRWMQDTPLAFASETTSERTVSKAAQGQAGGPPHMQEGTATIFGGRIKLDLTGYPRVSSQEDGAPALAAGSMLSFLLTDNVDSSVGFIEVFEIREIAPVGHAPRVFLTDRHCRVSFPHEGLNNATNSLLDLDGLYTFRGDWFLPYAGEPDEDREFGSSHEAAAAAQTEEGSPVDFPDDNEPVAATYQDMFWEYAVDVSAFTCSSRRYSRCYPGCTVKRRRWIRYVDRVVAPLAVFAQQHESLRRVMPPLKPYSGPYQYSSQHRPRAPPHLDGEDGIAEEDDAPLTGKSPEKEAYRAPVARFGSFRQSKKNLYTVCLIT